MLTKFHSCTLQDTCMTNFSNNNINIALSIQILATIILDLILIIAPRKSVKTMLVLKALLLVSLCMRACSQANINILKKTECYVALTIRILTNYLTNNINTKAKVILDLILINNFPIQISEDPASNIVLKVLWLVSQSMRACSQANTGQYSKTDRVICGKNQLVRWIQDTRNYPPLQPNPLPNYLPT